MVGLEQPLEKVERISNDRDRTERNTAGDVVGTGRRGRFDLTGSQNGVELSHDPVVRFDEIGNRDADRLWFRCGAQRGACPMNCGTQFLLRIVARNGDDVGCLRACGFEAVDRRAHRLIRAKHAFETRRHDVEPEQQQRLCWHPTCLYGGPNRCWKFGFGDPTPLPGGLHVQLGPVAKQSMIFVVVELLEQLCEAPVVHHSPCVGDARIEPDEVDLWNVRRVFQPHEALGLRAQQGVRLDRCQHPVSFGKVVDERRDASDRRGFDVLMALFVCVDQGLCQPLVGRHDPVTAAVPQQDVVERDQRLRLHRRLPGKTRNCRSGARACQTHGQIGYNAPPSLPPRSGDHSRI